MCGIFGYFSENSIDNEFINILTKNGMKIKYRGPDNTQCCLLNNNQFIMFHRLCINDLSDAGNQPLLHPDDSNIILICNGEIFNFKDLKENNKFIMNSLSDCEIILHLYKKFGIDKTVRLLDGDFAFILIDNNINKIYVSRDPFGVRSLYIGTSNNNDLAISSELKSLHEICNIIEQFKPGCYMELSDRKYVQYYSYMYPVKNTFKDKIILKIQELLEKSVIKRMISDRPIGCLLSGGLDSSLITALVVKNSKEKIKTFSVGFENSVDIINARKVAEFLETDHYELILTEEEMLQAIEKDIELIESYDTTTIRASTPMYLLCKYIKENTDITVIFSGEGSDEASGSYMYFHNAPSANDFNYETCRLLKDLCYFDVLRGDKSSSSNGLEIRVPFLDKEFIQYYMSISPDLKMPSTFDIEKYLLRKSFEESNIIPNEILWRKKEGMSDGVSKKNRGWFEIIQEYVCNKISDDEMNNASQTFPFNTPKTKESLYFRKIFNKFYPGREDTIPYYWLPKWCGNISEPSARVLNCYNDNK